MSVINSHYDPVVDGDIVPPTSVKYTPVAIWLFVCAAMVYAMIVVGGITRLTESGLSIVEWAPLMGIMPPLNQIEWLELFQKYRQFPEYLQVNKGMSLEAFKAIFWWEYLHRLFGRLIGVVFFLPFLYFLIRRRIPKSMVPGLVGLFILGAIQGGIGWYMVKSGLVNEPNVSQYRLVIHLFTAVIIYCFLLWLGLRSMFFNLQASSYQHGFKFGVVMVLLVLAMIISGGFVAGTHAGHIYNTFPKMGDSWIPQGLNALSPFWHNLTENTVWIQFQHRFQAYFTAFVAIIFWITVLVVGQKVSKRLAHLLMFAVILQVTLGILTLINVVPVHLGAMHQAGSVLVLTFAIMTTFSLKYCSDMPEIKHHRKLFIN